MSITATKITPTSVLKGSTPAEALPVISKDFNKVVDDLDAIDSRLEDVEAGNFPDGVTMGTTNSQEFTVLTTLTAAEIVGTAAGDIGHASGAILVPAPGAGFALEFVSAVFVYDYATAAYTGGADDMRIRVGTVSHIAAMTDANILTAVGDKVYSVSPLNSTEKSLPVNSTINLYSGTAYTNPGTAAGVLRVYTTYRKIATGL